MNKGENLLFLQKLKLFPSFKSINQIIKIKNEMNKENLNNYDFNI